MRNALDLQNEKINKLFFSYFIPALTAGLVSALYILVDGIFIGRGIGADGLAAIGIVVPIFTLFSGLSLIFSIGGATQTTISMARGNQKKANNYFTHSIIGITTIMVIATVLLFVLSNPLLKILGASGNILGMANIYLKVMVFFSVPYTLAIVLPSFIRVEGYPKFAMIITVIAALINIAFDYVFIFVLNMGMFGAAIATGMGNTFATIVLISFFVRKRGQLELSSIAIKLKNYLDIIPIGFPTFLTQLLVSVTVTIYNLRLLELVGDVGVAAYSAVGYLIPLLIMIFASMALALQPIASANFGSKQYERAYSALKLARIVATTFGVSIAIAGSLFNEHIMKLFLQPDSNAYQTAIQAIPIMFLSYMFIGITMMTNTFYQSIGKPFKAMIMSLLRGLVILIPSMYILSSLYGVNGMWLALPFTELIVSSISLLLVRRDKIYRFDVKDDK